MTLGVMLLDLERYGRLDLLKFFKFSVFEYTRDLLCLLQAHLQTTPHFLNGASPLLKSIVFVVDRESELLAFLIEVVVLQLAC